MRRKKEKGYWIKRKETFNDGTSAQSRAGHLRTYEHVKFVHMDKLTDAYVVTYCVAKPFYEQITALGIEL